LAAGLPHKKCISKEINILDQNLSKVMESPQVLYFSLFSQNSRVKVNQMVQNQGCPHARRVTPSHVRIPLCRWKALSLYSVFIFIFNYPNPLFKKQATWLFFANPSCVIVSVLREKLR